MVYYESVKDTIDVPSLAKVIINVVVCYHGVSESIVIDWGLLFISKFWSLLYYFLEIKKSNLQPSTSKQKDKQRDKTI